MRETILSLTKKLKIKRIYRTVKIKLTDQETLKVKKAIYESLGLNYTNSLEFPALNRYKNNGIVILNGVVPIGEIYRFAKNVLFIKTIGYSTELNDCLLQVNKLCGTKLTLDSNHLLTKTIRAGEECEFIHPYRRMKSVILTCPKCGNEIEVPISQVKITYEAISRDDE